ncbi:MAG TPA: hypothetical protein VOA87_01640 [Thermoanaerobaculia bacterium]|nr:hypothetical protein [Thermoanaerobaculia bacterium]
MRRTVLCLTLLGFLALGRQATAVICTIDDVPAATLLLPYFEVDLANANGVTTLFSVNNASATAVLAHVVVWSDLSVPVLDFNVYLTGYDVQSVNLRDILVLGNLPQTASLGQDPNDTISPQGLFSQDINFASCQGQLPLPHLPASFLSHLQTSLTGQFSSILGGCAGLAYGDNVARGYVTVDTVNNCTLRFPGDLGYFAAGGTGDATDQNVLWGDYFYVNSGTNRADGNAIVHIEASATNPQTSVAGQYTFYGRYDNWTAVDNREPLATNFAGRFVDGGAFNGGTQWVAWRDSKVKQGAFKCGTTPAWYPLGQEAVTFFDEQEHPFVAETFPISPQPPNQGIIPFPAETQSTQIGGPAFPIPFSFGWIFLNLNTTVAAAGNNPPEDPAAAQAWVEIVMSAEGRYSVGFDAIKLDSACAASHLIIVPPLG